MMLIVDDDDSVVDNDNVCAVLIFMYMLYQIYLDHQFRRCSRER